MVDAESVTVAVVLADTGGTVRAAPGVVTGTLAVEKTLSMATALVGTDRHFALVALEGGETHTTSCFVVTHAVVGTVIGTLHLLTGFPVVVATT